MSPFPFTRPWAAAGSRFLRSHAPGTTLPPAPPTRCAIHANDRARREGFWRRGASNMLVAICGAVAKRHADRRARAGVNRQAEGVTFVNATARQARVLRR